MRLSNPAGVLFDLDGVLIDSLVHHVRAWQEAFAPLGVTVPRRRLCLDEGRPSLDTARDLNREYGLGLDDEGLEAVLERKRHLFRNYAPRGMLPEARVVVMGLKARRVPLGLVTGSARENVEAVLSADDLALFDVVVTAEDYIRGKPSPEPYLTACRRLGLNPGETLAVENAPLGIASAKAAGLLVFALTTTLPAEDLADADRVLPNLTSVLEVLSPSAGEIT